MVTKKTYKHALSLVLMMSLITAISCKKGANDSSAVAKQAPGTNQTAANTSPSKAPEKTTPAQPVSDNTKEAQKTSASTDSAGSTAPNNGTSEETLQATKPEVADTIKAPEKPLRTVCVRACNKAQMCGRAGGSGAAECMQKCLELGTDENKSNTRAIESFRAQESCANVGCEDFDSCVQRELARRRQLAPVPAYDSEKADITCTKLCEQEQKCKPEIFIQLRKNMSICKRYCTAVLTGTDNGSATARTIMGEAIKCLGRTCDAFEACMQ